MCSAKVSIVGTGFVGSTIAYSLMLDGAVSKLALIDRDRSKAEGHALDLMHGMQFTKSIDIYSGDSFELVSGSDIVILCAGFAQKKNQTRSDLLEKNVNIFKQIIPKIIKYNKDCILLVVTNPLDVMTYVTYKLSGFNSSKVFGTGTVLDTSRLRYLTAKKTGVSPKDISAYILGEHGDSQFVWWSHANIAGVPIKKIKLCSEELLESLHEKVKNSVYDVIDKKGSTYFAISTSVSKIVKSIVTNQFRVFTVSSVLKSLPGFGDVCLSTPAILGKDGICSNLTVDFDSDEEKMFFNSVKKINAGIELAKKMGI